MTTEKDKYVSSIKRYFDIHFKVLENSIAELNSKFININLINSELDEINKEISTLNNKQNELVVSLNEQIKQMPLETKQMYRQIECFYYLNRKLNLNNHLPCLRGWVASPDILLFLHDFIIKHKPVTILEFGSGVSTLVIASALRQNGSGKLYSIDHDADFAKKTSELISNEKLNKFVDLRVGSLIQWEKAHMNNSNQEVLWYNIDSISDIENIDLLFVDGPPKRTCRYSRYPAITAVYKKLSDGCTILADDTVGTEDAEICKTWAEEFNLSLEFFPEYEKGLGILSKK